MASERRPDSGDGDHLKLIGPSRRFDDSAAEWLLGQAVRYLNSAGKDAEFEYARVVEVLLGCGPDPLETVQRTFQQLKGGDSTLRWSLLYVLGDAADEAAADFLLDVALRDLPEPADSASCEGERDMEVLVATGAVCALHSVAKRHPSAADHVLKLVSARPAQPILVEAVKVATDLGLGEKVRDLLADEDRWILDIRGARPQELFADPEREDIVERGFTPPRSGVHYTAPKADRCDC